MHDKNHPVLPFPWIQTCLGGVLWMLTLAGCGPSEGTSQLPPPDLEQQRSQLEAAGEDPSAAGY